MDYSAITITDKNEMIDKIKSSLIIDSNSLSPSEQLNLQNLLIEFWDIFAINPNKPSTTDLVLHEIDTADHRPINVRPYPIPKAHEEIARKMIKEMVDNKIIQWTKDSPWGFPIVLVPKPDGNLRFCVDYRKLNLITRTSSYPIPLITELMDCFHGARYFSSIDLASGYWQIRMHPDHKEKTTFNSKFGSYYFNVMPFGLVKAPATFQSLMDKIFHDVQWKSVCVYFDDIFIFSKSFDEHLEHLRDVFTRLRKHSLQAKLSKCHFVKKDIKFLGHIISSDGIQPDPSKIEVIKNWKTPRNKKDVRRFIGLASYYRKFIPHFSSIAAPLHRLQSTSKDVLFSWSDREQYALELLKSKLISSPILVSPDWTKPFTLQTDSSDYGIGAVLCQHIDGEERVIAYASKSLSKSQKKYMTSDKECYAIIWGIRHFRTYLIGRQFDLWTDHSALQFLNTMRLNRDLSGRLARYQMFLQEYEFIPKYRKGKLNDNADALSREVDDIGTQSIHSILYPSVSMSCVPCQCVPVFTIEEKENVMSNVSNGDGSTHMSSDVIITPHIIEGHLQDLPTTEELISFQKSDPELSFYFSLLSPPSSSPSLMDLSIPLSKLSPKERNLYECQKFPYSLSSDGLLLRNRPWNYETLKTVVIPCNMKGLIMHHMHADLYSAHMGIHKTYERTVQRFYWKGMFRDISEYVLSCKKCQQRKHPKKTPIIPSMSEIPKGGPWSEISFDALGPLPETSNGNKHIIVFMDRLTKSSELFAVKDVKEQTIAKLIVNDIIPRHGCPSTILSDNAPSFNSELLQQIYCLMNSKKLLTSAYNPQGNGQVERFNETLVTMLTHYVTKYQTDWDEYLNIVKGAYMSSPHPVTGYTPNYLLYGRELKLPVDTIVSSKEFYINRDDFLSKILQRTSFAQDMARARLLDHKLDLEEKQSESNVQLEYPFGSKVLIYVPDSKTRLTNKLRSRWQGPFQVIERTSVVNYRVYRRLHNGINDSRMVNVRRMKSFIEPSNDLSKFAHSLQNDKNLQISTDIKHDIHTSTFSPAPYSSSISDPIDEYLSNSDNEFEVQNILDKKILRGKSFYLVKWEGYPESDNTWEPLENLVNSSVLIEEFERKYVQMHLKSNSASSIPLKNNMSERILRSQK